MGRYLVVANQTLGGDQLMTEVRRRTGAAPSSFYVIVPNTRLSSSATTEDEHRATLTAQSRLNQALNQLRSEGLDARGDIGDPEPLTAIGEALGVEQFDEIIISRCPAVFRGGWAWISPGGRSGSSSYPSLR